MWKPPFQLTEDIGGQIAEPWRLQGRQLLSGLIAFLMEVWPRLEEWRYVLSSRWRPARERHHSLSSLELVEDICAELVELYG
jgi:hypothetical protein